MEEDTEMTHKRQERAARFQNTVKKNPSYNSFSGYRIESVSNLCSYYVASFKKQITH